MTTLDPKRTLNTKSYGHLHVPRDHTEHVSPHRRSTSEWSSKTEPTCRADLGWEHRPNISVYCRGLAWLMVEGTPCTGLCRNLPALRKSDVSGVLPLPSVLFAAMRFLTG